MRVFLGVSPIAALLVIGAGCSADREPLLPARSHAPPTASTAAPRSSWAPGEHRRGAARWRDTGVYLDGTPVAVLAFGELPVTLKPVWIEDTVSAPLAPGEKGPATRKAKQRHYRFTDYLTALGVDLRRVRELHVVGPKPSETIVVSGAELRRRGRSFLFRFGGDVRGKAIPVVPAGFGNGKTPDKISGVMVYVERKPPTLVRNQGFVLDGKLVGGVPYYGEPLRGGVRIYLDDRLAVVIKRRLLDGGDDAGGPPRWKLFAFLQAHGVDTSHIVEGWIVREGKRREKIGRAELTDLTFEASPQARGRILLGPDHLPVQVLALHSTPVSLDRLPAILPGEE